MIPENTQKMQHIFAYGLPYGASLSTFFVCRYSRLFRRIFCLIDVNFSRFYQKVNDMIRVPLPKWLRCSATNAKRSFNRSTNAIFGKVGRIASEEVTLQLVKSKCLPILLYGLECYSLFKADLHSLDFVVMRFLMKLYRTANKDIIDDCRSFCNFAMLTEMLEIKSNKLCKKFNDDSWDISISVLAKRFSFVVIVILLHTLVKVTSLFVRLLFLFFPSFISATIRGE